MLGGHLSHVTTIASINLGSICNLTAVCLMTSGQTLFEMNEICVTNKGQRMALTFGTCISSCTQLSVLYIPTFNTPRLR